jgi:hypothetical protein
MYQLKEMKQADQWKMMKKNKTFGSGANIEAEYSSLLSNDDVGDGDDPKDVDYIQSFLKHCLSFIKDDAGSVQPSAITPRHIGKVVKASKR